MFQRLKTVYRRHDCVQTFHAKKVTLFLFRVKLNSRLCTETKEKRRAIHLYASFSAVEITFFSVTSYMK